MKALGERIPLPTLETMKNALYRNIEKMDPMAVVSGLVAYWVARMLTGWLGGLLVECWTSVLQFADARFNSQPGLCCVKSLGKFLTPMCNVVLYNII